MTVMMDNQLYSLISEKTILGTLIGDPERFECAAGSYSSDDFYLAEHRIIYETIKYIQL